MIETERRLSPRITAALDVTRSLAACYVVLHHVAQTRGWTEGPGASLRFGQEAVLLFFLMSGFVIFANERTRALSPRGYYWRRARRIYPTLFVAMAVSTIVAIDNRDFVSNFSWASMVGTVLSLQDISALKPGVIVNPYLGNSPLWSLSYEVAFYAVFPLALGSWTRHPKLTGHLIGLLSCTCYALFIVWPNHFALVGAYFLIWWAGAMAAAAYLRNETDFRGFLPVLGWLTLLCLIAALGVGRAGYAGLGTYPFLPFRHFVAALILLVVLGGPAGAFLARLCLPLARPAAALASISYGLYVLHYPILIVSRRTQSTAELAAGVLVLIAAAFFADRWISATLPRAPRN